jgi:predicted DCC family thiol-disulfide oxidoreductase YuxK
MPRYDIFYDHACPMCRFEMLRLKHRDAKQCFTLIDISTADFDTHSAAASLLEMQTLLHILRDDGQILVGIDAIAALYQAIGRDWWTGPLKWQATRGIFAWIYSRIARHRYRISVWLGFTAKCDIKSCRI